MGVVDSSCPSSLSWPPRVRHTLPVWRAQGPDLLSRIGGLHGRGLVSSLGLLAMEASEDPAGGYSGPSQESKIPESSGTGHWNSNSPKHLSMPRSGCRIKLSLCSFLSCPGLSPPHPPWYLASREQCLLGEPGPRASATVQAQEVMGGPPGLRGQSKAINPWPGRGHRASKLT